MDTSHIAQLKTALIFGTDTGATEAVAEKIHDLFAELGVVVELMDAMDYSSDEIESFDFLIMGIPTWDFGGIQEDWENQEMEISETNFDGKMVAFYGLGDQLGYADNFLDAMGWLHDRVIQNGATVVGRWSTDGYDFESSLAADETKSEFCGLAIDEDNQAEFTDERIAYWIKQIIEELSIHSLRQTA